LTDTASPAAADFDWEAAGRALSGTCDRLHSIVVLGSNEEHTALVALESDLGDLESEVIARDAFVLAMPAGFPLGADPSPASLRELRGTEVLLARRRPLPPRTCRATAWSSLSQRRFRQGDWASSGFSIDAGLAWNIRRTHTARMELSSRMASADLSLTQVPFRTILGPGGSFLIVKVDRPWCFAHTSRP